MNLLKTKIAKILYSFKRYWNKLLLSKNARGPIITLGSPKYGSWTFSEEDINKDSIIYSFGIGENIDFDLEFIKRYQTTIFGFDPTPKSMKWLKSQKLDPRFKFYPWGLDKADRKMEFYPPDDPSHVSYSTVRKDSKKKPVLATVFSLETIMSKLHHNHIDLLKMDIEGSEYGVIDDIVNKKYNIKQILVEFHDRFGNLHGQSSKKSLKKLESIGYKIFNVSLLGYEVSLIKR